MFKGSYVALITPMTEDGTVDYDSLKKLIEFHLEEGTHGIVAVGTTGESATLPIEEHVDVVRYCVNAVSGRVPVVAGSGANSTAEAIELSRACADAGADGLLSVVPYYNKPQQRGMIAHFKAVADATELPVLLYNVPSRTVADMLPAAVAELSKHKNIVGIKEATGCLDRLQQIQNLVDEDFVLLSGDDASSLAFMDMGGHGVISVTANVAPALMSQLCDAATSGKAELAKEIDDKLAAMHNALFIESNPVLPKYCLYKMGLISTPSLRLPLVEAEVQNQQKIEQVMHKAGVLA